MLSNPLNSLPFETGTVFLGGELRNSWETKDIIKIKNEQQLLHICKWFDEGKNKINMPELRFPLKEGTVVFDNIHNQRDEIKFFYSFCVNDDTLLFEKYEYTEAALKSPEAQMMLKDSLVPFDGVALVYSKEISDISSAAGKWNFKDAEVTDKGFIAEYCIFLSIMLFMVYFEEEKFIKKTKVKKKPKNKKGKKKSNSSRRMNKVVYNILYTNQIKEVLDEPISKRKYKRITSKWTRKGHFRNISLKDGTKKSVWIEPQVVSARDRKNNNEDVKQGVYN